MNVFDFTVKDLEKKDVSLSKYQGDVLLIVNTATECGLAGQMNGLEELYQSYQDQGFQVLAFPCNQFAGQEPLDGMDIKTQCELTYNSTFPIFDKVKVNGPEANDLYKYLVKETKNKSIKWNFAKFLVDRDGNVVKRYSPVTAPKKMESDIQELLN